MAHDISAIFLVAVMILSVADFGFIVQKYKQFLRYANILLILSYLLLNVYHHPTPRYVEWIVSTLQTIYDPYYDTRPEAFRFC